MKQSLKEAEKSGALKPLKELKLSHESKKSVKEGIIFDSFEEDRDLFAVVMLGKVDTEKVAQREAEALYLYSPTQRNFGSFDRITALVLKAVKIFKLNLITSRAKSNIECQYDVQSLSVAAPSFPCCQVFIV